MPNEAQKLLDYPTEIYSNIPSNFSGTSLNLWSYLYGEISWKHSQQQLTKLCTVSPLFLFHIKKTLYMPFGKSQLLFCQLALWTCSFTACLWLYLLKFQIAFFSFLFHLWPFLFGCWCNSTLCLRLDTSLSVSLKQKKTFIRYIIATSVFSLPPAVHQAHSVKQCPFYTFFIYLKDMPPISYSFKLPVIFTQYHFPINLFLI